jgi:predicted alpha/beta hydrolase
MQAASDIFLGWQRVTGLDEQVRDFYLRQLRDWKGSADVDNMTATLMATYSRICAAALARAHARSGDRVAIASYLGNSDAFDRAIADFSSAYADQNERDYQALVDAVTSGRLEAQTGL